MDVTKMEMLLTELLNCGVLDLEIINDTTYDWEDIIEVAILHPDEVSLKTMFLAIVDMGLESLQSEIDNRVSELECEDELEENEEKELDALKDLDVHEDIEVYFNYLDSHVSIVGQDDTYKDYLSVEIDSFEHSTGFNLE